MSGFRDSSKALIDAVLRCPGCSSVNVPGAAPALEYDGADRVYCTVCSRSGPLVAFLPPAPTPAVVALN